jgi:hypothetical protein
VSADQRNLFDAQATGKKIRNRAVAQVMECHTFDLGHITRDDPSDGYAVGREWENPATAGGLPLDDGKRF